MIVITKKYKKQFRFQLDNLQVNSHLRKRMESLTQKLSTEDGLVTVPHKRDIYSTEEISLLRVVCQMGNYGNVSYNIPTSLTSQMSDIIPRTRDLPDPQYFRAQF